MRRRKFIALIGGVAAWPLAARTQQPPMPVIGFLSARSAQESAGLVTAFLEGLKESGYADQHNVAIEYRWANGEYDRLPPLAAELVNRRVAVIAAVGGRVAAAPVKAATDTIPIVFVIGTDPVTDGLVASFNKPGGNVTGATLYTSLVGAKRLQLLHEFIPAATKFGALLNRTNPTLDQHSRELTSASRTLGLQLDILAAGSEAEIQLLFEGLAQRQIEALWVQSDPFFNSKRGLLVALAARYRIPAGYDFRESVTAGGLMSYGASFADAYHQAGIYAGKILKGAKSAELPVLQPTKYELIINLTTAKTLGLSVPPTLLATADEVIE
jgi:putative ABC transport system substrate-binding protein